MAQASYETENVDSDANAADRLNEQRRAHGGPRATNVEWLNIISRHRDNTVGVLVEGFAHMKYVRWFLLAVLVVDVTAMFIYKFNPSYRKYFLDEDSLVENLSTFFFLVPFGIGAALMIFTGVDRLRRLRLMWIPMLAGFICFGEEISWGERVFNLNMPVVSGVKIDAIHDFADLAHQEFTRWKGSNPSTAYAFAVAVLLVCFLVTARYGRILVRRLILDEGMRPFYFLIASFGVFVVAAVIIDLEIFTWKAIYLFEELFELNAAMALVYSCLFLGKYAVPLPQTQPSNAA